MITDHMSCMHTKGAAICIMILYNVYARREFENTISVYFFSKVANVSWLFCSPDIVVISVSTPMPGQDPDFSIFPGET